MANLILINAEDGVGFPQNMERLSFEETAFSIYIQLVKLIFGEEASTHPQEKIVWWEISCIDGFGKDIEAESQRYEN